MNRIAMLTGLLLMTIFAAHHHSASSAAGLAQSDLLQPVDKSMHEFMEYYFQPTYQRLKAQMGQAEKSNSHWKAIKADAMILAEGGNLLLTRSAKDAKHLDVWKQHSLSVRDLGGQLYRAAKKRDQEQSGKLYRAMLQQCNQCHQVFADGKHQLKP